MEPEKPLVTVIVLNYNGAQYLRRCLESILAQTIRDRVELIVADNLSTDGSDQLAATLLENQPRARFLQNGANLGFCEGNNRPARLATGNFLFFMNNDAWMEPDCLEILFAEVQAQQAAVATPYVMNWADNEYQWVYVAGFDPFGLPSFRRPPDQTAELFMPPGCSYLIERQLFSKIGEFDPRYFMYADELDLSWRAWIAGARAIVVPRARLHHRGAAEVNPVGGERVVEYRTSESKRYYSNRNCLLTLLKNAQHLLLLLIPLQILLLLAEALAALLLIRRWSFVRKSYFQAIADAFRSLDSIRAHRRAIRSFRQRGDFFMLRFLRFRLSRWDEILQVARRGVPKVAPK